jgi:hypothetical protein
MVVGLFGFEVSEWSGRNQHRDAVYISVAKQRTKNFGICISSILSGP